MSPVLLRIISATSAASYFGAFTLCKMKKGASSYLWYVAIALNVSLVVNNFLVNGYVPFVSMYQVLTFLGVTFSLVYVYMRFLHNGGFMKPYFMIVPAIIMVGVTCMDQNSVWSFPPALQSAFFVPHVLSYMISYSLIAVAAVMTVINRYKKKSEYENGIYNLSLTSFPFMLSGMLLGSLWANECWGEYWQWDAKENWSLITAISILIYFHFRKHPRLKKHANTFVVLTLVFAIITLLFVNMFGGDSNHTYS